MKKFEISNRFYIVFTLLFSIVLLPATKGINSLLENIDWAPLKKLVVLGVFEPPTLVILIVLLLWLYVAYLWKCPVLNLIHGVPNINGRYTGSIQSSYDPEKNYKCVLEVRQTLTRVEINLFTERSSSWSVIANIVVNEHGNWALAYIYTNMPKTIEVADSDMRCHRGFATLEIFEDRVKLEGEYFNHSRERSTHGTISCKRKSRKLKGRY